MAEEVPNPKKNIPKGIVAQLTTGFLTSFIFYISVVSKVVVLAKSETDIVSTALRCYFA